MKNKKKSLQKIQSHEQRFCKAMTNIVNAYRENLPVIIDEILVIATKIIEQSLEQLAAEEQQASEIKIVPNETDKQEILQ